MSTTSSTTPTGDLPIRTAGPSTVFATLYRDSVAICSVIVIVVYLGAAVFAPQISDISGQNPYDYHQDVLDSRGAPLGFGGGISATHWFGVEPLTGRDLFSIVLYGARTSLFVGLAATALAMIIGVVIGATSGYFGGLYDRVVSWLVDVLFGFPVLIFLIALMALVPSGIPRPPFIAIVIGVLGWPGISRIVRSQAIALRHRNFVTAARMMGASPRKVLTAHVLPNMSGTIIVVLTIIIPSMIATEAALSFLGVGVTPPTPSWGRSIGEAAVWIRTTPMYLIFPGAALFLITLAFNQLGDSLRDALDPRVAPR